ncbi:MAG: DinB family protein [Bryobacteraceae bacterium]
MNPFSERLRRWITEAEPRLRDIAESSAGAAPFDPENWSGKQELGHLADSAINNRVRFVKAALEGEFTGPSYDGPGWVRMGGYATTPWQDVIDFWKSLNQSLAAVLDAIPAERFTAPCRIGDDGPVTLEFVIEDYFVHMQHHLDHIFAR